MINIMFVCHGNICRSPMAEFLFKYLAEKRGQAYCFRVESSATTFDAINSPVHSKTREILEGLGIDCSKKRAVHLSKCDLNNFDYFLVMDKYNLSDTMEILGSGFSGKVFRLLDFTDRPRDVLDPWYTNNFKATYDDIVEGINAFFLFLDSKVKG